MVDNTLKNKSGTNNPKMEEDPYFYRNIDKSRFDMENRLSEEDADGIQDTQTRSNIHISRDFADGKGDGPDLGAGALDPEPAEYEHIPRPSAPNPNDPEPFQPVDQPFAKSESAPDDMSTSSGRATSAIVFEKPIDVIQAELEGQLQEAFSRPADPQPMEFGPGEQIFATSSETEPLEAPEETPNPGPTTKFDSVENTPPTSEDAAITISEDQNYQFDQDDFSYSDTDGDEMAFVTITELPINGELRIDGNPLQEGQQIPQDDIARMIFVPDENANGDDYGNFKFTVNDGQEDSTEHSFVIDVDAVNDPPEAINDVASGNEDTVLTGNALDNDTDLDGDDLSVVNTGTYDTEHGTITINEDGSYEYTPDANYHGEDRFTYEVTDGNDSDSATINFTIDPANDGPVAVADSASGDEDTVLTGNALDNDTDLDGDDLSVVNTGTYETEHGTITISEDGSYEYTPDANYHGEDSFTYEVTDGNDSDSATINFTINDVEDPDQDTGGQGNNGWGNGDQDAPGDSLDNNNAENAQDDNNHGNSNGQHRGGSRAGQDDDHQHQHENNGWGNGDQDAPGNSLDNNNAENAQDDNNHGNSNGQHRGGSRAGQDDDHQHQHENNGWGNGDQDAPGNSLDNNNAENAQDSQELTSDYNVTEGNNGRNRIEGSHDNDEIHGGGGNDKISGKDGDDILHGDAGKDKLDGGDGNDALYGGDGNDKLKGGDGNDQLNGGDGNDVIDGGDGEDTLTFLAHQGNDIVDGGAGGSWTDTLELDGFDGQMSEEGWTISLNDGSTIESTDNESGEMLLSQDAAGTIEFDDGGTVTFENIEKIIW